MSPIIAVPVEETLGSGREGELVVLRRLSKIYGSNHALTDVELVVRRGEVLGLLGANGAGKSTLLNIVGGTIPPTTGELAIGGEIVDLAKYSPFVARQKGIQRVFQELSIFSNLSVAENLAMTRVSRSRVSRRLMQSNAKARLQQVFPGNRVSPRAEVGTLTLAERQMVEITRAATEEGTRLLILDEPTSALSAEQAMQLGRFIRRRAGEGIAIIYVTHKLDEALRLADRIVVLRDGRVHWDGSGQTITHRELLQRLGATIEEDRTRPQPAGACSIQTDDVLTIDHLSTRRLNDVSLRLGRGETVGLAGLEGAGQRELLHHIFGAHGRFRSAMNMRGNIAYVSGDRQREGVLPLWNVEENVDISALSRATRFGFVLRSKLQGIATQWLNELGLAHRARANVLDLSGGNQQRMLLGRGLASGASLLLLDDPTRGVDVNAKREIYSILDHIKEEGRSVLFYSTENAEFLKCDRVYVMARGGIAAEFLGSEATEERIVQASYADPASFRSGPSVAGADTASVTAGARNEMERERARTRGWTGDVKASGVLPRVVQAISARIAPAAFLLIGMLIITSYIEPDAISSTGLTLLLDASLPVAFAALAQMLFILGGDIDLGLGFAVGFVNAVSSTVLIQDPLLGLLILSGVVAGYVAMALIVELLAVPSVVVTLGASFVWLGLGLLIQDVPGGNAPAWLATVTSLNLSPIPEVAYVLIIAALIGIWTIRGWAYGTVLRALGSNHKTLVDLGYSALRARVTLYAISAALVVVAGLLVTATVGAGDVNASASLTLGSVAAVVVGGASFSGGRVSPVGAVMAVAGLSLISSILVLAEVNSEFSTAIGGIVLILVLGLRAALGREER